MSRLNLQIFPTYVTGRATSLPNSYYHPHIQINCDLSRCNTPRKARTHMYLQSSSHLGVHAASYNTAQQPQTRSYLGPQVIPCSPPQLPPQHTCPISCQFDSPPQYPGKCADFALLKRHSDLPWHPTALESAYHAPASTQRAMECALSF